MKRINKFIYRFLLLSIIVLMVIPSMEAAARTPEVTICEELNILRGEGQGLTDEYLNKKATRLQAAIITLRLWGTGYENTALNVPWANNFEDAEDVAWEQGRNVMGFLKANSDFGWRGSTDGKFYPNDTISSQMLYKTLLEVLGYRQDYGQGGDFLWSDVTQFAAENGLWVLANNDVLTNGDLATALVEVLSAKIKGGDITLAEKLIEENVIDRTVALKLGIIKEEITIMAVYPAVLDDVEYGGTVGLPSQVKVLYSDLTEGMEDVKWNKYPDVLTEGLVTIYGKISGTDLEAAVTYRVLPPKLELIDIYAHNLKEVSLVFSGEVDGDRALDPGNYLVHVGVSGRGIIDVYPSEDKKTVTLVLQSPVNQQQKIDVTVKEDVGLEREITRSVTAIDNKSPEILSIEPVGTRRVKVTFSEPVTNISVVGNFYLNGRSIKEGSVEYSDREAIIILKEALSASINLFGINENIADYAGNRVGERSMYFTVKKDDSLPEIEKIVKATQTELVVEFSKAVENILAADIVDPLGSRIIKISADLDMKVYTMEFARTQAINPKGTELTFKNVTDMWGNKSTIKLDVVPVVDTTAPRYLGYEVVDQNKIILEFSKDVLPGSGSITLFDGSGGRISLNQILWHKDARGNEIRNKLVLRRLSDQVIEAAGYTLKIDGVTDYTPMENPVVASVEYVEVIDQIKPEVVSIRVKENQMYIRFSEKVTESSALNRENYRSFNMSTYASEPIDDDLRVELLPDNMTVMIEGPKGYDFNKINVFQISSVKDLAGNVMEGKGFQSPFLKVDSSPSIVSAGVIGKNQIELTFSSQLKQDTLRASDFTLTAGSTTIGITSIEAKENGSRILLATSGDFTSDGKFNGLDVTLSTALGELFTTDIYGQTIAPFKDLKVKDKYTPRVEGISSTYSGANTDITLILSENIKTTYGSGRALLNGPEELLQFIVLVDGKVHPIISSRYDGRSASTDPMITLTVAGNYDFSSIRVLFFAGISNKLTDYSPEGNPLENFEM